MTKDLPASTRTDRTVLVVDDDPSVRLLCRANLEGHGLRVLEASDGDEALHAVHRDGPDAILLDIKMPRLSGWEVAAALLNDRASDQVPIIFISGLGGVNERVRAFELGAVGYLTKPFDPELLAPTVICLLDQIERGERSALIAEKLEALQAEIATS